MASFTYSGRIMSVVSGRYSDNMPPVNPTTPYTISGSALPNFDGISVP